MPVWPASSAASSCCPALQKTVMATGRDGHDRETTSRADTGWYLPSRLAARSSPSGRAASRPPQPQLPHLTMNVALESPDQSEVIALIAELDAYQDTLYPPESRHALDLASLKQPSVLFAVARDGAFRAQGCGAVVLSAEFGELKRMYVSPQCRDQGVGKRLIDLLESKAAELGCSLLQLETGPFQPEALGLYERCGYERRGPFGQYTDDPLSVFMQKRLPPPTAAA